MAALKTLQDLNPVAMRLLSKRRMRPTFRGKHRDRTAWGRRWRYLLACGWLIVFASLACAHDSPIDTICIRGQLSAEQAAAIKPEEYATWPTYCEGREDEQGHNGHADCQPHAHDRVLVASCAEALKDLQR